MKVYNKLTSKEIDEVLIETQSLPIKESLRKLWALFKDLEGDRELEELKTIIKFKGYIMSFDIRSVIYGEVEEYYDTNSVRIKGCEKIKINSYWDELEMREKKMKEILRESYPEEKQIEGEVPGHE